MFPIVTLFFSAERLSWLENNAQVTLCIWRRREKAQICQTRCWVFQEKARPYILEHLEFEHFMLSLANHV